MEIVVGLLERRSKRFHNSAARIGPHGLAGIHRKRHLPYLGADRFVDEPEGGLRPFNTSVGRLGIAICYEIRFPEVMRSLALAGSDFIALPTNWPIQSALLAEYFTRVRAAENFMYFLVASRADCEGGTELLGQSQIVDPLGEVPPQRRTSPRGPSPEEQAARDLSPVKCLFPKTTSWDVSVVLKEVERGWRLLSASGAFVHAALYAAFAMPSATTCSRTAWRPIDWRRGPAPLS